jgi:hypothetical protein
MAVQSPGTSYWIVLVALEAPSLLIWLFCSRLGREEGPETRTTMSALSQSCRLMWAFSYRPNYRRSEMHPISYIPVILPSPESGSQMFSLRTVIAGYNNLLGCALLAFVPNCRCLEINHGFAHLGKCGFPEKEGVPYG